MRELGLSWDALIPLGAFWLLLLLTVAGAARRARLAAKTSDAWVLDVTGLLVQGWAVPFLEAALVVGGLVLLVPGARGALDVPPAAAFLLNFIVIDYVYYWNHRALHSRALWPVHAVHHSLTDLDVLGTSRNTLWSSALIVYLWLNGAFLFLLADPTYFALSAALTAALDLWRHGSLGPKHGSGLHRALSRLLVTPADHAWHHSSTRMDGNFGANLSLWDRMHGTWIAEDAAPATLGQPVPLPLWRRLLWPFSVGDEERA